jgi:hypothetical protein
LAPYLSAKYIFNKAFVAPAPYYVYNVYVNINTGGISISNPNLLHERATSNETNIC